jgi:5-methylcytosine-specific restriction endonuclease McrA
VILLSQTEEFRRIKNKCASEGSCRICGSFYGIDPHHVVYRSLGGTNDPRNIIPACRPCHIAIHDKAIDLLSHLLPDEQGYAAWLIGIERAHRLLAPSVYRVTA